ncbi:hypothetical protein L861_14140 [Litchfieldella anticariensis FP35 = DSM 16096]|uniref:Antirestriction protein n=1 Tax=Litchfieldella anticariensis (strain DSM 16096 / CECT 5854 / CIP 108499 / LMG 22089 / FP35) TaxID=1121939 RepID=S2KYG4_LITA3|nr:zincin-like metallopeptidase domain-containing protein [Halomonas anticariensis]EPC00409.1 hypothetical protein L861_14140 [Halomonas anticariensis FP35 = DSM 16096]
MTDIYQTVTDRIIQSLEQGVAPWIKPWDEARQPGQPVMPQNAITGRPYHGINIVLLWLAAAEKGYHQDRWLTFNQARQTGGTVSKGETSTLVCFYKPMVREVLDDDGRPVLDAEGRPEEKHFAILKGFNLFNVVQCEGLPAEVFQPGKPDVWATFDPVDEAERLIAASGARIDHVAGEDAFYSPIQDRIQLPARHQFAAADRYYSTALHELVHWTGHRSRLSREAVLNGAAYGSEEYAFEELIAEMGMAFLCGQLGVQGELQHERYIASWLMALKNDKRMIFKASGGAREATEFLLQRAGMMPEGMTHVQACA